MNENKEQDTLDALVLIIAGVILLLNNFEVLPWSVWSVIFKFWPLLLVSWGTKIAFGKRSIFYTLSIIAMLLAIFYSITIVSPSFDRWIERQIPQWKNIKNKIPWKAPQVNKRKIFRCDPITGECQIYYR